MSNNADNMVYPMHMADPIHHTAMDPNRFGVKYNYDPQWKGPTEVSRTPTDKYWFIAFLVYLVIYFACAVYAFVSSDLKKLENIDGNGRVCGIDQEFIDKPYVMHLNLKEDSQSNYYSPKVCVSQCPDENFMFDRTKSLEEMKPKLMCTDDVNITAIDSIDEIDSLISKDKCAGWYLRSRPVLNHCIPDNSWSGHEMETITTLELSTVKGKVLDGKYYLKKLHRISQLVWKPTIVTIISSAILALLAMLMLRYWCEPFFYISIVVFVALLTTAIYFLMELYAKVHDQYKEIMILVVLVVCVILVISIVVSVLCTRTKIHLACMLVEESAKSALHLPATLACPFVAGILNIAILAFAIVYLVCLLTITVPNYAVENQYPAHDGYFEGCYCQGEYYRIGDSCDPDVFNKECTGYKRTCEWQTCELDGEKMPSYVYVIHAINLLGFIWMVTFTSALELMVLSGTFATWYWTLEKSVVGNYAVIASFVRTVKYHLGTIALGSLVLTITQCITAALKQGAHHQETNSAGQFAMTMMYHQSSMFEAAADFLSKNGYVMCAVHGTNFYHSCKSAFNLIMRNLLKVIVVHTVADVLFCVTELLVMTISIGGLITYLVNTLDEDSDDDHWIFFVSIIVAFIGCVLVCTIFIQVLTIAVHTIFLCFVEDTERNDGSSSRPYYMNTKLENLLKR